MEKEATYPRFYRNGPVCVRQDGPAKATIVQVPEPEKSLPLCLKTQVFRTPEQLEVLVRPMKACGLEVYESYLAAFFQKAAALARTFAEHRQKAYERANNNKQSKTQP